MTPGLGTDHATMNLICPGGLGFRGVLGGGLPGATPTSYGPG